LKAPEMPVLAHHHNMTLFAGYIHLVRRRFFWSSPKWISTL